LISLGGITGCRIPWLASAPDPTFEIKDYLGRHWEHELVEYKITPRQAKAVAGRRLVDGNGREVLYQLDPQSGVLVFQADIEPFGATRYAFDDARATATSDMRIGETAQAVELANSLGGIRLAKSLSGATAQTPLLAWRLASGEWAGGARFDVTQQVAGYDVRVLERGPVRSRAVATTRFGNGDIWTITLDMQAHEPAIKVHERFDCATPRTFRLDFSKNFNAAFSLSRSTSVQPFDGSSRAYGTYIVRSLAGAMSEVVLIEPWVHWGGQATRTTSFSLAGPDWSNVVYFAASSPEKWVDPAIPNQERAAVAVPVVRSAEGDVTLTYTLARGEREYLIGSVPGDADRASYDAKKTVPTQGQLAQMKHSDFPLDRVKSYTLAWPLEKRGRVGFLSEEHQRTLLHGFSVDEKTLAGLRQQEPAFHNLEAILPAYLVTRDPVLERKLVEASLKQVQEKVDLLVRLDDWMSTVGMAPHHHREFVTTCNMLSTVYRSGQMTADERQRLDAQLAFLGYLFSRDAFCSVDRGFAGFPNMTACVYGVRAAIASVVPGHPMRTEWMKDGVGGLRAMFLDKWSDGNGQWHGASTESLSYTRLTFDLVLGALYQSYASGVDPEAIYHPTIRLMGQWYGEVATPRDARIMNWRHDPPVGHVYRFDMLPSQFALLAFMWKERDPGFAANMKWMQLQQGNQQVNSVGGFIPSFAGYRKLFMANDVEPKAPRYESRHWKESSVILRSHFNHELENMLYMIAGRGHSHYDQDSGSVTIWGKGEIIADDFGYYGYAPGSDHSMIDSPAANPARLMSISDFQTSDVVDYTRGEKDAWTRRVMHVKHPDPAGPNYFVLHDVLATPSSATWRLWLSAQDVQIHGDRAIASGLHRIDSDIVFARLPPGAALATERKTRTSAGVDGTGRYLGSTTNTQIGLILDAKSLSETLAVVYPRLKTDPAPQIVPIAGGKGLRITTAWGTDFVFASDETITFTDGPLSFEGTVGFARVVDGKATLDLKEGGTIAYGELSITNATPRRPETRR
jgi:hypothetical protein